jgi:hypothetical protein
MGDDQLYDALEQGVAREHVVDYCCDAEQHGSSGWVKMTLRKIKDARGKVWELYADGSGGGGDSGSKSRRSRKESPGAFLLSAYARAEGEGGGFVISHYKRESPLGERQCAEVRVGKGNRGRFRYRVTQQLRRSPAKAKDGGGIRASLRTPLGNIANKASAAVGWVTGSKQCEQQPEEEGGEGEHAEPWSIEVAPASFQRAPAIVLADISCAHADCEEADTSMRNLSATVQQQQQQQGDGKLPPLSPDPSPMRMITQLPRWSGHHQCFVQKFRGDGRVKLASTKNFMLMLDDDQDDAARARGRGDSSAGDSDSSDDGYGGQAQFGREGEVVLQFGKRSKSTYSLDFQAAHLTAMQAFSMALAQCGWLGSEP